MRAPIKLTHSKSSHAAGKKRVKMTAITDYSKWDHIDVSESSESEFRYVRPAPDTRDLGLRL